MSALSAIETHPQMNLYESEPAAMRTDYGA